MRNYAWYVAIAGAVLLGVGSCAIGLGGSSLQTVHVDIENNSSAQQGIRVQLISAERNNSRMVYCERQSSDNSVAFTIKKYDFPIAVEAILTKNNEILYSKKFESSENVPATIKVVLN